MLQWIYQILWFHRVHLAGLPTAEDNGELFPTNNKYSNIFKVFNKRLLRRKETTLDSDNVTKFVLYFTKEDHVVLDSTKLILT